MTRFTQRIRATADRIVSATTMERLIDPILTDIELESREHLQRGRVWRARLVVLSGYVGLAQALLSHAIHGCGGEFVFDGAGRRTAQVACVAFVLLTTALTLPPLMSDRLFVRHPGLAIYLVPQAIPMSIPIAVSIGIVWGWSKHRSARAMVRRLVVISAAGAVISLATMEWLVPAAHDGFVSSVTRLLAPTGNPPILERGVGERSLSELTGLARRMSKAPSRADRHRLMTQSLRTPRARPLTAADVNLALYIRTALGVATIALALLAAAIASVIRRRTLGRSIFVALVLLYIVSWLGAAAIAPIVAPAVSAWLPNAAVATVALGFVLVRARQTWRREMPTV